ncbi:MAG TPA: hypothetical protein VFY44_02355 [Thermoleophilaceae bacterium]|nr:hypothetical protein [Thermoleophilaceae bacterium]
MPSLVRLLAITASAVLGLSLLIFALDQSGEGRDTQLRSLQGADATTVVRSQEDLDVPKPAPEVERVREQEHSSARELIDDGNDILVTPFTGIVGTDANIWIQRLVTAGLGLALFGFGGLMLAAWLPQKEAAHTDWREAGSGTG